MLNFSMVQSVKVLAADGALKKVGELLQQSGYKKPFIVCDKFLSTNGTVDKLKRQFKGTEISAVYFDDVQPDPPSDIVDRGAKICVENGCDCVIGIGGGSALDTAKGINIVRVNGGSILDYAAADYKPCGNLITIPTTSGTGSELSNGAIITNIHTGRNSPLCALIVCANTP